MNRNLHLLILLIFGILSIQVDAQQGMIQIPGGTFVPLYRIDTLVIQVEDFYLDQYPVSNKDFLEFAQDNPQWQKENIKALFADEGYLRQFNPGNNASGYERRILKQPVTNISWFAAMAYCESKNKRLPETAEWELVAMASEKKPDGYNEPGFYQKTLDWYSKPGKGYNDTIGSTFKNYYGIWDMYGLVWEWVSDFNSALLTGESRGDVGLDRNLFCAGGAIDATDVKNYVAFMRYAFRASLKANYSVSNLGFRCAKSIINEN